MGLDTGVGLCQFRLKKNHNSDSLTVFGIFLESIPESLAKRIVKFFEKESFFDSQFLLSKNGNRNWDSQFLILRNRHSTTLEQQTTLKEGFVKLPCQIA